MNGFLRESEKLFDEKKDHPYYNIIEIINFLCMAYYFNEEYFAATAHSIHMNDIKDVITKGASDYSGYFTALGNININGDNDTFLHQWTFKILQTAREISDIHFGIDSSKKQRYTELVDFDDQYWVSRVSW